MIPYFCANLWLKAVFPDKEFPINPIFSGIYKGKLSFSVIFWDGYPVEIILFTT